MSADIEIYPEAASDGASWLTISVRQELNPQQPLLELSTILRYACLYFGITIYKFSKRLQRIRWSFGSLWNIPTTGGHL
jgi:hypothetical protein